MVATHIQTIVITLAAVPGKVTRSADECVPLLRLLRNLGMGRVDESVCKERCLLSPIDSDLHSACDKNEPYLVSKLLAQGANLESQDPLRNYRTPLIRAALNNSYEIVIILLLSNYSRDSESMYLFDDQGEFSRFHSSPPLLIVPRIQCISLGSHQRTH